MKSRRIFAHCGPRLWRVEGAAHISVEILEGTFPEQRAVVGNGPLRRMSAACGAYTATAFGINDGGRVVGSSLAGTSSQLHAFVYDLPNGPMRDVSPKAFCWLNGVNNSGDAVGACRPGDRNHAFIWTIGAFTDLNDAISDPSGC
jgi:probable HAF family extracellular repeat protein